MNELVLRQTGKEGTEDYVRRIDAKPTQRRINSDLLPGILVVVIFLMVYLVTETWFATFVCIAKKDILPKNNATLLASHECMIGSGHLGLACLSSRAVYILASPHT